LHAFKILNVPTVKTVEELRSHLSNLDTQASLALVPTMGALHQGHLALFQKAVDENAVTVVSIFVNPTQFNNVEDLDKYPRTLEADSALIKTISDEIVIFVPSISEVYPKGQNSKSYDFQGLERVMEGTFREGHFDGVGTVVEKLLNLVKPDRAYFGEKDFQQLQIIRRLVELKKIPVEIIGCPIVREASGLARSSRNERLSKALRKEASFIFKTLNSVKKKFGTKNAQKVIDWAKQQFERHPDLKLEYIIIAETDTLKPIKEKRPNTKYRVFTAVYAGEVRLIDNIALN
jgi:pantoate--beta-alanine ligase